MPPTPHWASHPHVLSLSPEAGALVRIISDLHYGHPRCEAPPPEQLVEQMRVDSVDILVVAGDLAETRPLHHCYEQGCAMRDDLRTACARAGIQLIELAGNHDPDAPHMLLRLWQGHTIVLHGHMLFDEVAPWGWEYLGNRASSDAIIASYPERHCDLASKMELAQRLSLAHAPIHRARVQTPLRALNKLLHCFWPPARPYQIVRAWMTAAGRAERFARVFAPDCEQLVFGHFHRCGSWQRGGRHIYCMGAWFHHARPAYLDIKDKKVIRYSLF